MKVAIAVYQIDRFKVYLDVCLHVNYMYWYNLFFRNTFYSKNNTYPPYIVFSVDCISRDDISTSNVYLEKINRPIGWLRNKLVESGSSVTKEAIIQALQDKLSSDEVRDYIDVRSLKIEAEFGIGKL